jgi:L,D-transpeptidase catalytic domain
MVVLRWWMVVGFTVVVLFAASTARGFAESPVRLPAAGVLLVGRLVVRSAPRPDSRVVRVLGEFRSGGQFQVILAVRASRDSAGGWWYELSLPGRPNGQRGWVPGRVVDLRSVPNRIVVHVRARSLEVRRIADGRVLLRAVVAVGKRSTETPIGRDFYVQARYVPEDPFYGPFVLQTSAYSVLRDWPGGGLVGIHGTDEPGLLGDAVSHGCVRVSNAVAVALERLAPLGTPVDLLP